MNTPCHISVYSFFYFWRSGYRAVLVILFFPCFLLKKATLRTAAVIAVFGNRTAVLVTVLLLPHRHPEPKAKDLDLLSIDYEPIIGACSPKTASE